jgi:hypothetical protein
MIRLYHKVNPSASRIAANGSERRLRGCLRALKRERDGARLFEPVQLVYTRT